MLPRYVTFDCYGTLTDFNLTPATLKTLGSRLDAVGTETFLRRFEEVRYEEVLGEYRPYRQILRDSLRRTLDEFGLEYRDADGQTLIDAVPTFGPFPDVPPVLARLRQHCGIVILSNTEDDLIAPNVEKIGVPFDAVITAEQARAYKPNHAAFKYMRQQLGCEADEILHVAQGFLYDIVPAHEMGWNCVWINRRNQTGDPAYGPYSELPDLSGLPELMRLPDA